MVGIDAYLRRDYVLSLVKAGKRIDGRSFDELRSIEVERGYVKAKAPGSAFVSLGDTKVVVGVSLDVGEPYPDAPDQGVLVTTAEVRPMASPYVEPGPPSEEAIEIARVVDRGIRSAELIELEKLFIEEGKVWVVFVDIHVIDDCGNVIDAAGLAALAAILDARVPKYEDNVVVRQEFSEKLPLKAGCYPTPCTIAKVGDKLLVDPNLDEEYAMTARLTITTSSDEEINAIQKGGEGSFKLEEVDGAIDLAFRKAKELRKAVSG